MDPVPDPLLLRKSGSARNRTRTSGYVARNSDHNTREAVRIEVLACQKQAQSSHQQVRITLIIDKMFNLIILFC
jgi:hypothetical protein